MRDIIIIVLILSAITFGSVYMHSYYDRINNEFRERLDAMSKDLSEKRINTENSEELEKMWLDIEKILITFQAHDFADHMEEFIYECLHYYEIEEIDNFELSKRKLLISLDDLSKREHVTLVNIM